MTKAELEEWKSVHYRIEEEGIDYTFMHYSNFEEIKDEKFHQLRQEYLKISKELKNYVEMQLVEI